MPVYLLHGFRWPREGFTGVRVHAIIHNLEECSAEYIQNPSSRQAILDSFNKVYPDIMKTLSDHKINLEFIEQYNPEDESDAAVSQPFAFVGDRVVTIAQTPGQQVPSLSGQVKAGPVANATPGSANGTQPVSPNSAALSPGTRNSTVAGSKALPGPNQTNPAETSTSLSLNIDEVLTTGPGLTNKAWEAIADLRDKIAAGEKIGWWVVYNGDPERAFEPSDEEMDEEEEEDEEDDDEEVEAQPASTQPQQQRLSHLPTQSQPPAQQLPQHLPQRHIPIQIPLPLPQPASLAPAAPQPQLNVQPPKSPGQPQTPRKPARYSTSPPISFSPTFRRGTATQHIAQQINRSPVLPSTAASAPSPGLTALPEHEASPAPPPPPASEKPPTPSKSKIRDSQAVSPPAAVPVPAPAELKERPQSRGLRKKFFGKRT